MKGNGTWLWIVVIAVAVVAVFLLFGLGKRTSSAATASPVTGSDGISSIDILGGFTNGATASSLRRPGESYDTWLARRNAEGWKF